MHDSQTLFFFTVWVWTVWDVSFHLTVHLSVLKASRRHHPFSVLTRKPSTCPLRWKHHWTFSHSRPGCTARTTHIYTTVFTHAHSSWEEQWPLKLFFFNMNRHLDCPLLLFDFSVGFFFQTNFIICMVMDHMSKVKKKLINKSLSTVLHSSYKGRIKGVRLW